MNQKRVLWKIRKGTCRWKEHKRLQQVISKSTFWALTCDRGREKERFTKVLSNFENKMNLTRWKWRKNRTFSNYSPVLYNKNHREYFHQQSPRHKYMHKKKEIGMEVNWRMLSWRNAQEKSFNVHTLHIVATLLSFPINPFHPHNVQ